MAQQSETVQIPQTLEELQNAKVKHLRAIVKVLKAEDIDLEINANSKKSELVEALAEYMGFTSLEVEEKAITEEVTKEISEQVADDQLDVLFENEEGNIEPTVEISQPQFTTGDEEVDSVLAELGLDGTEDVLFSDQPVADGEEIPTVEVAPENIPVKEEKPKRKRNRITIKNGPRIPIREYEGLTLGIYGDILEPLEEKDSLGYEWDIVKLERYNAKAHEAYRKTRGNMVLLMTRVGASYLVAKQFPNGHFDPIIEVTNKGRGHLRCKQYANMLQLAYVEKDDIKIIDEEEYQELVSKIELMEIKWDGLEA